MAIIDYLKRYHPQDNETFDMVAHNFMMHREIAQLLQSRAQHILETFREMNIGRGHQSQSTDSTNGQFDWQTICRSSGFFEETNLQSFQQLLWYHVYFTMLFCRFLSRNTNKLAVSCTVVHGRCRELLQGTHYQPLDFIVQMIHQIRCSLKCKIFYNILY